MAAEDVARTVTPSIAARQLIDPSGTINADFYRVDYQNVGLELHAGASNNVIASRTFGIIDAGAGNDLIDDRMGGGAIGDVLYGGPGADRITGSGRGDLIIGGAGDDRLAGAAGDDTYYVIAADPGVDVVNEVTWYLWDTYDGTGAYNADSGFISTDTVEFGPGIALADLHVSWGSVMASYASWSATPMKAYETLDLSWASDKTVRVMLPDRADVTVARDMDVTAPGRSWGVEYFKFADGTRITADDMMALAPARSFAGSDAGDVLVGKAGSDLLAGGPGDDLLQGDTGNDTYQFNVGDGADTIQDARGYDKVLFGPGITSSSITLGLGSLLLRVGDNGDAIHVEGFDPLKAATSGAIEAFEFSDGSQISYQELLARGFDLYGTAGSDVISGTSVLDRVLGYAGDDTLDTGAGDDTLDGGAGNDLLRGGSGSDRYVFSKGFGHDRIEDHGALQTEIDTVVLDALHGEVSGKGQEGMLTLTVGDDTADELQIVWNPGSYYGVERVQFSDGTVWDESVLAGFFP
jgi:Ca2+-binding RTX toxin-like protein